MSETAFKASHCAVCFGIDDQGRPCPGRPAADRVNAALMAALREFLDDEGNHVGGVWGDYGTPVVSVEMVRDVIAGKVTPPVTDEDYAYTKRDTAALREQSRD